MLAKARACASSPVPNYPDPPIPHNGYVIRPPLSSYGINAPVAGVRRCRRDLPRSPRTQSSANGGFASTTDVAHALNSHHADERVVGLVAPEPHSCRELLIKLVRWHVGLLPAVRRDHVPVGPGCAVDDLKDPRALQIVTRTDYTHSVSI